METVKLKEYLGIVVDMEKNIYMQKKLIAKIQNRANQLGIAYPYEKPAKPTAGSIKWPILFFPCVMIIGGLIFHTSQYGVASIIVGSIMAITMIYGILSAQREKNAYDVKCSIYKGNVLADQDRINKELSIKRVIESELDLLRKQHENSKRNLKKIYDQDIIFPKYRNMVLVCSLYEYICSKRCYSLEALEGHEGAYNIPEREIRLDHIIMQLDQVIARLDAIKENQYMLYSAIQETNQKAEEILKSTNCVIDRLQNLYISTEKLNAGMASIERTSAATAYCTQRMQEEMEYIRRVNIF